MGKFFTFLDFRFASLFICFCSVSFEEEDKSGNCCGTSSIFFTFTDFRTVLRILLCFLGQRRKNLVWERRKTALNEREEVLEWLVFLY